MKQLDFETDSVNLSVILMSPFELIFKGKKINRSISGKTKIYACYCGNGENAMMVINKRHLKSENNRLSYYVSSLVYPGNRPLTEEETSKVTSIYKRIMNYDK